MVTSNLYRLFSRVSRNHPSSKIDESKGYLGNHAI